ncbi:MAG: type II secretion system protein [Planctomycetota bacterium]
MIMLSKKTPSARLQTVPRMFAAQARAGLTLIELIVVLTILVALGGLIVPILPGLLAKTHQAKCATTIPEVNKLWIQSFTGDLTYPDVYDSLLGAGGTALAATLPGAPDVGGQLTTGTLNAAEITALNAIGVTSVVHLDDASTGPGLDNATVNAALLGTPIDPLADGDTVAMLAYTPSTPPVVGDATASMLSLGIRPQQYPADAKFLVFGIGQNCTGVGAGGQMIEAPIHFGGEEVMNPAQFYQRYCVIFMVSASDQHAEFVCACSIHPDGFDGAEAHVRDYYDDQR